MDTNDLTPLIEDLEGDIDDLEAALAPLLSQSLSTTASTLPLLDRAKLYTTSVYAIENLLYNALNLSGVDPKTHAIKTELDRVKQYFAKINAAEHPVGKRGDMSLDKAAAGRFVKAALAGNDRLDRERAEQIAKDRAKAEAKLQNVNRKRKHQSDVGGHQAGGVDRQHERHDGHAQDRPGGGRHSNHGPSKPTQVSSSPAQDFTRRQKSHQPPRTKSELANALKNGPLPKKSKKDKKKEKRRHSQQQQGTQELNYG